MLIIGGWGKKSEKVADAGINKCKNCNNRSLFEVRTLSNTVSAFFVPVAKWNKRYYLVCLTCEAGFEIPEESAKELLVHTASLPDNQTSLLIYNSIDKLFVEYIKSGQKLEKWNEHATTTLKNEGFSLDNILYILSSYNQSLIDSQNKS